jgi:D-inositol-3-phosphate glycosyltransferase
VDAVVHGETGLLVDPTDHVAVADALTQVLASRETAEKLGQAAAFRAQEFAWPKIARRVEDVLLSVAR